MPNVNSAAGFCAAYNVTSPKYADLANAMAFAIVLNNTTGTDITSGTITIETAHAKADDFCAPDGWAPLRIEPDCAAAPGTVAGPATIEFSEQHPLKAGASCSYGLPCPEQFVRVTGVPSGVDAIAVIPNLRRANLGPLM
jgi:hypothetical protein